MKVKMTHSKTGETQLNYIRIYDKQLFRFRMLKKIIEDAGNQAVLLIDTNQSLYKDSGLGVLDGLRQAGIEPVVIKIPVNSKSFFGVQVNFLSKSQTEYLICLELKGQPLTEEMFGPVSVCDIAVGINQTEPITNQFGMAGTEPMMLLKTSFKNYVYDSILCQCMNSNFDFARYLGEIADEMGL